MDVSSQTSGRKPTFLLVSSFDMRERVISKIEEIVQRVAQSEGIELVEVELKGGGRNQLLRISIDKPEGVTHADCELISQQVGTILDVEDVVPGKYTLEVSSPGVERKLFKPKYFGNDLSIHRDTEQRKGDRQPDRLRCGQGCHAHRRPQALSDE